MKNKIDNLFKALHQVELFVLKNKMTFFRRCEITEVTLMLRRYLRRKYKIPESSIMELTTFPDSTDAKNLKNVMEYKETLDSLEYIDKLLTIDKMTQYGKGEIPNYMRKEYHICVATIISWLMEQVSEGVIQNV